MKKYFFITVLALTVSFQSVLAETPTSATYWQEKGVISGYADGSLRLENPINRAEFLKVVMKAAGLPEAGTNCFNDVGSEWFAGSICSAQRLGIVGGRADGLFHPADGVRLNEALKMIYLGLGFKVDSTEGEAWYSPYLETAAADHAIPKSVDFYDEPLTRGEAFEILWRLAEERDDQPAILLSEFKGPTCADSAREVPANVDMNRVRDAWLSWTNEARAAAGLSAYSMNSQLDRTAYVWSVEGRNRGTMTHQRVGTTAYYDYYAIQSWFKNLGVTFDSVGGVSFTENIGRGPYSCRDDECTDEVISAMRYTFDYFMSEKGKSYRPHYNSIMSGSFKVIGFGMVLSSNQYYMTVHYGTTVHSAVSFCD